MLACLAVCSPAFALSGIVRGGEHGEFTRLTISVDSPVQFEKIFRKGERLWSVEFSPKIETLDVSRALDRINAGRLVGVSLDQSKLLIETACDCTLRSTDFNSSLLIIDIETKAEIENSLSSSVGEIARVQQLTEGVDMGQSVFSAFHRSALVDDVSNALSVQMMKSGPINSVKRHPPFLYKKIRERIAFPESRDKTIPTIDPCSLEKELWSNIRKAGPDGNVSPDAESLDRIAIDPIKNDSELERRLLLNYLVQGLPEESLRIIDGISQDIAGLSQVAAILDELTDKDRLGTYRRILDCGPISTFTVATDSHESFVSLTNEDRLDLLHTFRDLPIGFKLLLYPRLHAVAGDDYGSFFVEFERQRHLELALASNVLSENTAARGIKPQVDADGAAAMTLELRDTEFEKASWRATLDAYLAEKRFFDALSAFEHLPAMSQSEKRQVLAFGLTSILKDADTVTFLQIAMSQISEFRDFISDDVLASYYRRLIEEGFADEAETFAQTYSLIAQNSALTSEPPGPVAATSDNRQETDRAEIDVSELDNITVQSAQTLLTDAGSVREELQALFTPSSR